MSDPIVHIGCVANLYSRMMCSMERMSELKKAICGFVLPAKKRIPAHPSREVSALSVRLVRLLNAHQTLA